jgi:hypothetical protein
MMHPLAQLLVSRPELLADHLAGYGALLAAQAGEAAAQLRVRAALAAGVMVGTGVGLGLAGMAALLAAALPLAQMPAPELLLALPLLPLAGAAGCALALRRRPPAWSMDLLRQQLAADALLLRQAAP